MKGLTRADYDDIPIPEKVRAAVKEHRKETEKTNAESWLDERGYDDGQDWDAERAMSEAARREDGDGPSPCRWRIYNQAPGSYPDESTAQEHPGYVWPDGSGVYVTEGWWDVVTPDPDPDVETGRTGAGTLAVGPV